MDGEITSALFGGMSAAEFVNETMFELMSKGRSDAA